MNAAALRGIERRIKAGEQREALVAEAKQLLVMWRAAGRWPR